MNAAGKDEHLVTGLPDETRGFFETEGQVILPEVSNARENLHAPRYLKGSGGRPEVRMPVKPVNSPLEGEFERFVAF